MTVIDTTPQSLDVRDMTDDHLLALYREADELTQAAAMREAARRDRDKTLAASRRKLAEIHAEGYDAAYAQYLKASDYTRGNLLSDYGRARVTDEMSLWTGSKAEAERNCSEELRDFWMFIEPRITPGTYARQRGAHARIEREQARDEREARNGHDHAGQGLAGHEPGALRHEETPPRAPQARPGSAVDRGRPVYAGNAGGGASGRAAGPVQRDRGDMGVIRTAIAIDRNLQRKQAERQAVAVPQPATVVRPAAKNEPRIPGDQLLDLLRDGWFGHYARFPSPAALDAVTLWAAHCWMRDENGVLVFRASPRLFLLSSAPGSGKSFALELIGRVAPSWYGLDLEPTAAGLVHTISKEHATVTLDEADLAFGAGARHEAVRAIINGGTYRHGTILNGKGAKANRVSVFGPLALAGLDTMETGTGDKLKPLFTRGPKIRMEKAAGENRPPNLTRRGEEAADKAKMWLERWAAQVRDEVADAEPEIPEGIEGRAEDIWTPLLAVADAAGGSWPERARAACAELALGKPDGGDDLEDEFAEFAGSFGQMQ